MSGPESNPSVPILTVTWDTVIGARHVGYDQPVSLGEMVVQGLVERMLVEIKRDVDQSRWHAAVREASDAAREAIKTEATVLVREALTGEFQPTNGYGERTGKPTTLRDLIRADVVKFLNEKTPDRNNYNNRDVRGGFRELLQHEVNDAMSTELRGVIQQAREQVIGKVRENAAALIADAVKGGLTK